VLLDNPHIWLDFNPLEFVFVVNLLKFDTAGFFDEAVTGLPIHFDFFPLVCLLGLKFKALIGDQMLFVFDTWFSSYNSTYGAPSSSSLSIQGLSCF